MEVPLTRVLPVLCFRFGPFEAHVKDELLLRNGERVPLQRLPFQMLLLLLERAGELVTKDELRDRLWTETTNVEFTNSLQVAAAKLREALGESVANPVYFKTVSRKGYQFIAEAIPVLGAPVERIAGSPVTELLAKTAPRQSPSKRIRVAFVCFLSAAVASGAWVWYRHVNTPAVRSGDTVLLGSFTNSTGLPELDGVFTSAFHRAMQESPYLRFLRQPVAQGVSPADPAHPGVLKQELAFCRQQQADILLTADLNRNGQSFRVKVSEWKCINGHLLTEKADTATSEKDILSALDVATISLRRAMGEHEETLKRFSVSMQQATTRGLGSNGTVNRLKARRTVWINLRFLEPAVWPGQKPPKRQIPVHETGSRNQSPHFCRLDELAELQSIIGGWLYFAGNQLKWVGCSVAPQTPISTSKAVSLR